MAQRGFSMIEVLISLVIIATALLGTAGLQMYGLRMAKGGEFRTQAVFLAADIGERMEANKLGAVAAAYQVAPASAPHTSSADCSGLPCSAADLADWDIAQWEDAIVNSGMVQPSWSIEQVTGGNPATYRVTINWQDRASTTAARNETFSYTTTRVVGLPNG